MQPQPERDGARVHHAQPPRGCRPDFASLMLIPWARSAQAGDVGERVAVLVDVDRTGERAFSTAPPDRLPAKRLLAVLPPDSASRRSRPERSSDQYLVHVHLQWHAPRPHGPASTRSTCPPSRRRASASGAPEVSPTQPPSPRRAMSPGDRRARSFHDVGGHRARRSEQLVNTGRSTAFPEVVQRCVDRAPCAANCSLGRRASDLLERGRDRRQIARVPRVLSTRRARTTCWRCPGSGRAGRRFAAADARLLSVSARPDDASLAPPRAARDHERPRRRASRSKPDHAGEATIGLRAQLREARASGF